MKHSWFTMLCEFQVYSKVIQLHIKSFPDSLLFFATAMAYGSSQARDWIWASAAIYATSKAMPDPLTHCTGTRINPSCCSQILNPLCHSRNSHFQILFPYRLLQDTEYSSLCCTVGPSWLSIWLSILYIVVCTCWFYILNVSLNTSSSFSGIEVSQNGFPYHWYPFNG